MLQSDTVTKVLGKLAKARRKFVPVVKDSDNPHFRSKYADLASYLDAVNEGLDSESLILVQATECDPSMGLLLTTTLADSASGEWIGCAYPVRPTKEDPQGYGSALTYARRYSIASLLCLAAEDDDGNLASQRQPREPERRHDAPQQPAAPVDPYVAWMKKEAVAIRIDPQRLINHLAKALCDPNAPKEDKGKCLRAMHATDEGRRALKSECVQYGLRLAQEAHDLSSAVPSDANEDADPDMP